MKINIRFLNYPFVIVCLALILLNSCKKDEDTNGSTPAPTSTGTMTANIDNVLWEATSKTGTLLRIASMNAKRLDLQGSADNKRIILTLEENVFDGDYVSLGTYDFEGPNYNALFTYSTLFPGGGSITEHIPVEGNFTITKCDINEKKVSGTFNFRSFKIGTTDTLDVTDGVFTDFPYTVLVQ